MEIANKGEEEKKGQGTRDKGQGARHREGPGFKAQKPGKSQGWKALLNQRTILPDDNHDGS